MYGSVTFDSFSTMFSASFTLSERLAVETLGICGFLDCRTCPEIESDVTPLELLPCPPRLLAASLSALPIALPIAPGRSNNCLPHVEYLSSVKRPPN